MVCGAEGRTMGHRPGVRLSPAAMEWRAGPRRGEGRWSGRTAGNGAGVGGGRRWAYGECTEPRGITSTLPKTSPPFSSLKSSQLLPLPVGGRPVPPPQPPPLFQRLSGQNKKGLHGFKFLKRAGIDGFWMGGAWYTVRSLG